MDTIQDFHVVETVEMLGKYISYVTTVDCYQDGAFDDWDNARQYAQMLNRQHNGRY